ncbi:sulfite exporter TauE/SafE family protein [Candidatus Thioglobus autotrophicus]|uniref:sulfite exporter TauE/SafE family protein n=1 Tax=Candidatus Thioglobus autotrophicus TaxID=1705394 RepID=UPI00299EBDAE|nr:sulfite exporter TauE/SafE family protein [Candidatus Thioglobus autotrophicus]WPE16968.1 sulfite exporter TauE/SafE family protein [Candidatus Thioglobus autotrophicus]
MEAVPYIDYLLPLLFFIVAFVYSSVGMGGGSSYTAIMVIAGMSTLVIPMVSLSLNLFVTTIGSYNYLRNKHGKLRIILPFLFSAIPFAYVGGALHLPKQVFLWILLFSLILVAIRIYFWKDTGFRWQLNHRGKIVISLIAGSILGLVAGIVGIGGGIYLVPLIIMLNIGTQKEAAAAGVVFVWVVSLSGLVSRLHYNSIDLSEYIPLIVAVIMGGFLGSYMGSFKFNPKTMEKILGLVILVAIALLIKKIAF